MTLTFHLWNTIAICCIAVAVVLDSSTDSSGVFISHGTAVARNILFFAGIGIILGHYL